MVCKTIIVICISILQLSLNDTIHFYDALNCDSKEKITILLNEYEKIENPNSKINMYKGALLVKLANYLSNLSEKLHSFKQGRELIENEISKYPENTEYRFIRLILQEQTPPFLNYKNNISDDKKNIIANFNKVSKCIQHQIINYSKQSKIIFFSELPIK